MALYKYANFLQSSSHEAFDQAHGPSYTTPFSGLYRCTGCGHEVTSVQGHPLPPQNHHQHSAAQGSIRWQLIVATG